MVSGDQLPRNTAPAACTCVKPRTRLANLEQQVLGRVFVGDLESGLERLDHEQPHVSHRFGQDGCARERAHLPLHLVRDALRERRRRGHQQGLRVGAVFGLSEQIGGDELGARVLIARSP